MLHDFNIAFYGGVLSNSCTYPLGRIKSALSLPTIFMNSNFQENATLYYETYERIIKMEGLKGLWRGNFRASTTFGLSQGIGFGLKDYFKRSFKEFSFFKIHSISNNFLSGGISGLLFYIGLYPLQSLKRIRINSLSTLESKESLFKILKYVWKTEGIRSLYSKCTLPLFGYIIYRTIYFGIYDSVRDNYQSSKSHLMKIFIAFFSSFFGLASQLPFHTIQSTFYSPMGKNISYWEIPKSFGLKEFSKELYRREGVKGFFKSDFSFYIKILTSSALLVFYDSFQESKTKNY